MPETGTPDPRTPDPAMSLSACLGTLLRRLRALQGLTQTELGRRTGYDGSYVGAAERAAVRPSRVLIERCDHILQAGGALLALWPLADREWVDRAARTPGSPRFGRHAPLSGRPRCRRASRPRGRNPAGPLGPAGPRGRPRPRGDGAGQAGRGIRAG